MGLKPDHWIRKMVADHKMIEPFEPGQVRNGRISYGVSSYGERLLSFSNSFLPILFNGLPESLCLRKNVVVPIIFHPDFIGYPAFLHINPASNPTAGILLNQHTLS